MTDQFKSLSTRSSHGKLSDGKLSGTRPSDTKRSYAQSSCISAMSLVRRGVQILFLIITIFLGIKFYLFVAELSSGAAMTLERPPGVEAFLPISALISLKYLLLTGIINSVHPSALILFLIICSTALVFKKGFCSWICPIGLLSEYLAKINSALFKKELHIPRWADLFLRGIKYAIAGFFLWSIFFNMRVKAIDQFIQSPYNTFADLKMLEFFTKMSFTSFMVITVLLIFSIIVKEFWCRYLCPYGAILGFISFFSMGKIRRNDENCIKCGKCEKVCPGRISIMEKKEINSLECSACLRCVDICPAENAIGFSLFSGKRPMNQKGIALVLIAFFTLGITVARVSGHWQNKVPAKAYQQYLLHSRMPDRIPMKIPANMDPEKMKKMVEMMQSRSRANTPNHISD